MKLSQKILNSINAVKEYSISFDAKHEQLKYLTSCYLKALEMEKDNIVVEVVKKVTKLQTLINAAQAYLNLGYSLSESIQFVRTTLLKKDYGKTESVYVSKIKKHFKQKDLNGNN